MCRPTRWRPTRSNGGSGAATGIGATSRSSRPTCERRLAYLSNFPLDIIRLDKSFIDRVATTAHGETMVRAVVDLARNLGLTAIAEGVEDAEQALALEHLGCQLAQGFLFARPMPATDLAVLLERQSLDRSRVGGTIDT